MKLRIIIPSLGRSRYLSGTLESIDRVARCLDLEVYLVLPSGTTVDVEDFTWLNVCNEPGFYTGGMYGAINIGASIPGDWTHVTYINDDDGLIGGWAGGIMPNVDIQYGRVSVLYDSVNRFSPLTVCRVPRLLPLVWCNRAPGLYQQGTIISRKIFSELGGFDSTYRLAGDHAFWLRAWSAGASFAFRDELVAYFRIRDGQLSQSLSMMEAEINRSSSVHGPRVWPTSRALGWLYWRLLGVRSLAQRLHSGLPWSVRAGGEASK